MGGGHTRKADGASLQPGDLLPLFLVVFGLQHVPVLGREQTHDLQRTVGVPRVTLTAEIPVVARDEVLDADIRLTKHSRVSPRQEVSEVLERLEAGLLAAGLAAHGVVRVVAEESALVPVARQVLGVDLDHIVQTGPLDAHRHLVRPVVPWAVGPDWGGGVVEGRGDGLGAAEVERGPVGCFWLLSTAR